MIRTVFGNGSDLVLLIRCPPGTAAGIGSRFKRFTTEHMGTALLLLQSRHKRTVPMMRNPGSEQKRIQKQKNQLSNPKIRQPLLEEFPSKNRFLKEKMAEKSLKTGIFRQKTSKKFGNLRS